MRSHPTSAPAASFIPLAEIKVSVAELTQRGVAFAAEKDDLDEYEIAYLSHTSGLAYAIMHYQSAPADKVSLLVSTELYHAATNQTIIRDVAAALGIAMTQFNWRSRSGETLGAVQTHAAAD